MATAIKPQPQGGTTSYNGYNLSPNGASGNGGIFGTNINQIGAAPSIYSQLQSNVPNYTGLTAGASGDISNELNGQLSTGTQNLLQNKAASMGVNVGQPGGSPGNTITNQNFLNSLGLTSEGLSHQGLTDYNQFSNTQGSQQQSPELLTNLAEQNAVDAAAPNPMESQSYAQSLFDKYLAQNTNPAAGTQPTAKQWAAPPKDVITNRSTGSSYS